MATQINAKNKQQVPTQERLRDICWDTGTKFPLPFIGDQITFAVVHPRLGYLQWHTQETSVERLKAMQGDAFHGAALVVRVYDVTAIEFDGFNAHSFFDLDIGGLSGNYYLPIHELERNLMAEVGFRLPNHSFHALARSNTVYFDRDRPSVRFHLGGLYVGRDFQRVFPVENVMDAPVYEKLNFELRGVDRKQPLSLAVVHTGLDKSAEFGGRLGPLIDELTEKYSTFQVNIERFGANGYETTAHHERPLTKAVEVQCQAIFKELAARHREKPFEVVHCHDWHSIPVGISAVKTLKLPLVLSLHSTEYERSPGGELKDDAVTIYQWEKEGVTTAPLVIVPHSSTRHQVISLYEASPEKIVIIPDIFEEQQAVLPDPAQEKRNLGLNPEWPVVLFAGEISHAAGADILMDALITVSRENHELQLLFAGHGPLKEELERRTWHGGPGHRCRFLGDVSTEAFERLIMACDFVVIPARTWQDEGLAQMATSFGKPVLATHQSHIHCIEHGQNGLLTYDNPGSIVWGIKELLANPLHGNMLRLLAKQKAVHTQSLESVAAEHYIAYEKALANMLEESDG